MTVQQKTDRKTTSDQPILPSEEQIENSSLYDDEQFNIWYLFTNHIGVTTDKVEYTDAI